MSKGWKIAQQLRGWALSLVSANCLLTGAERSLQKLIEHLRWQRLLSHPGSGQCLCHQQRGHHSPSSICSCNTYLEFPSSLDYLRLLNGLWRANLPNIWLERLQDVCSLRQLTIVPANHPLPAYWPGHSADPIHLLGNQSGAWCRLTGCQICLHYLPFLLLWECLVCLHRELCH